MDSETTIAEMKEKVKKFCEERDWDQFHNAKELAIGMILEAAEVLDPFRYMTSEEIDQYVKKNKLHLSEELSDVLFPLLRIAQRYDIDISEAFNNKMVENEKKYSVEKAKGSNKKYNEY